MKDAVSQNTMPDLLPAGPLDECALQTKTDKHSGKHDYLRAYEWVLHPFRNEKFTLLELGVGQYIREAGSLKTWKAYFPEAEIVGVDIKDKVKEFEEERVAIEIGNASKPWFLRRLMNDHSPRVIIDDASHRWSHQILSLQTMFPMLEPGGVMIVEDIHTSFFTREDRGFADADESFCDVLQRIQTIIASGYMLHEDVNPWEYEVAAWTDVVVLASKTAIFVKRHAPVQSGLKHARAIRRKRRADAA